MNGGCHHEQRDKFINQQNVMATKPAVVIML